MPVIGWGGALRDERGVMLVLFSIVLTLLLFLGSVVVSVGSWYTHGRHLQTKADAAAFAGGGSWGFPCAADVDANIEEQARRYVGPHMKADGTPFVTPASTFNPQVGHVQEDQIHTVLNGPNWYDADTVPLPLEKTDPAGSMCEAMVLDVKATEQDSPLLWGWVPFWPDIKKKARIQIEEAHGVGNLLPIGVRVPKPVSAAAVFYDESPTSVPPKRILDVRYFTDSASIFQLPAGLAGLTTEASEYARVNLTSSKVGVVAALSFRRACNTFDAPGGAHPKPVVPTPPGFPTGTGSNCFEDGYGPGAPVLATVEDLCNQSSGAGTQIVDCFYSTGSPVQTVQSGLHFLRGYPTSTVGSDPPAVRSAYLEDVVEFPDCIGTAYYNSQPILDCKARLHVKVDLGDVMEDIDPGPGVNNQQTRIADNVEVRYKQVDASGNVLCNFGSNCALQHAVPGNQGGTITFSTQGTASSPHLDLQQGSLGNSVAIEVRLKDSSVSGPPPMPNCGPGQSFGDNCRWFHIGTGISSTSVNPPAALINQFPIQRAFMGTIDNTGPVQWLRLESDDDCDPGTPSDIVTGLDSASRPFGTRCFVVEMGTKGGAARDQDELSFAFNEGTGPNQMGSLLCDPAIPDGQILIDGVVKGCFPLHGPNGFDTTPLCPDKNILYNQPDPGPPFEDWPPVECVIRRATGSMNQLITGLQQRILGGSSTCPPDIPRYRADGTVDPAFRWGRNYWHRNNNNYDDINFANLDGSPPTGNRIDKADPRLVTLFFTPYDSFAVSAEKEYPIVALGSFYITGWGRLNGSGNFNGGAPDDPCTDGNVGDPLDGIPWGQGNEPPPDLMACGGACSGVVVYGHFIQGVLTGGGGSGSGEPCRPFQGSLQVCIPVLVE